MELRISVTTVSVNRVCRACYNGTMQCIGNTNDGEVEYVHECNNCGHEAVLDKCYPYTEESNTTEERAWTD